ncbi:MAG TPA: hypothetical protein PKC19_21890, partial [Roseiflexaceae bacterium]|nr:hypothetical protein [Roseiflexaceae bacterium]
MRQARADIVAASVSQPDAYLSALLEWLRLLLAWRIDLTRATYGAVADDAYRGLYISDDEAEILSADWPEVPPELRLRRAGLHAERQAIERDAVQGPLPALYRLAGLFDLTSFERDVLLLALAPEVDPRYERLYAYIQDDVTRKRPTVALALQLLCEDPADRRARAAFAPDAPLLRYQLIHLVDDGLRQPPLLSRAIKLDDRIVGELLDTTALDPLIDSAAVLVRPTRGFGQLVLPPDLVTRMQRVFVEQSSGLVLALQGGYGSGRRAIAAALCHEYGIPMLDVDLDRLAESDADPQDATLRVIREATLRGAAIFWRGVDRLLNDDGQQVWRPALLGALDQFSGRSFLPIEQPWESRGALRRAHFLRIELPQLSYSNREQIWRQRLGSDTLDDDALQALASTFRLSGGQIRDAAAMA